MNPAISEHEAASLVAEMFDHFCAATTMRQILGLYRNMCDILALRPGPLNEFYPKFKAKIRNWKAQALWKKFDARASHRVYNKGTAASGTRVLVIGAGPCGLRTAIEAQLLGAKVVVVEKRDRISRNNVLHLWPFLITDLKALGAKKFYGKFCAGSIDHISIRQLQCILLKVALLLGVEVHEGVSFGREIEPKDGCGWRAAVSPEDHAVSHYEFDVLIGADGKRNTLEGFKRKEFRGKLAIAITANFINKKTEAEAKVEEISGVAFIFNQSFFKELYHTTGIDLENIVYYKDETHYFVMTAKKHSLLDKGVIMQDYSDPAELLSSANVDTTKLLDYAREAANFSTKYQMPNLEFAVNHYGKPDVAMFDFTSMFAADNSCQLTVRKNYRLLSCLVGDSLLEPFWPTGSGCARGFLSSMDAAYAIKLFSNPKNSSLAVLATRESIYRLLAQTTPENLHRDIGAYTLDPSTRYPNLNKSSVNMIQVKHLLDTDDPALLEQTFLDTNSLTAGPEVTITKRKRRTNDTVPLGTVLLRWVKSQLKGNEFVQELTDAAQCFTNGRVLCTLINRYRPDLVNMEELDGCALEECNEHAFSIFEDHLGIPRVMSGLDSLTLTGVESKSWLNYLEQICEVFRGEIPHVKHPKLDYAEFKQKQQINSMEEFAKLRRFAVNRIAAMKEQAVIPVAAAPVAVRKSLNYHNDKEEERMKRSRKVLGAESNPMASPQTDTTKRAKKRRSYDKFGNIEERTRRLQEIDANRHDRQVKRRLAREQQTQNFFTSLHMLQANTLLRESDSSSAFEDYSLFMYRQSAPEFNDRVKEMEQKLRYPDRDRGLAAAYPRSLAGVADGEQFSDRIKSMEQRIVGKHVHVTEKKPKDLLRAIGKIDSSDWNVKEIEKKIELSKKTTDIGKSRERVPKWNREQFLARQNKLTQQPDDEKYKEFDSSLKAIDKQLKEGHNLDLGERGKNKVASIAGQLLSSKQQHQQQQKTNSKAALVLTSSGVAEKCHFCKQRVYLMEKISAEGLTLHRSCLKCHHCHTNLRLGGYAFDRDDPEGKFYCTQHFKLPSKSVKPVSKKSLSRTAQAENKQAIATAASALPSTPDSKSSGITNFDLLDRGETPERIEFENADELISDGEEAMEVIDENEWTDRNFGTESDESDENFSSSDESDSESESDYEEAAGSPLGAQTLQLASEWISDKRFSNMVDSDDDFYGYSSEDDEADSQTEGEELARAREMRMQEVKLMPPPTLPTDTETEVAPKQQPHVDPTVSLNQLSNSSALCTSTVPNQSSSAPSVNNPSQQVESPEEKALKEKMLQKLSVREQWLHSSSHSPSPAPVGVAPVNEAPKPKTSFFGGLMNSLSTLIKPDKPSPKTQSPPPQTPQDSPLSNQVTPVVGPPPPSPSPSRRKTSTSSPKPPPSPTPSLKKQPRPDIPPSPTHSLRKHNQPEISPSPTPSLKKQRKHKHATPSPTPSSDSRDPRPSEIASFDEVFKDDLKELSSGRSTPLTKRRTKQKSSEVREGTDDFLDQIKQDQAALAKRMKKLEAKKFQSNMQSIMSAVDGPRIVGVKSEKDVSKFFSSTKKEQLEQKPKQLPNKDVSALQGVNLSKYFPTSTSVPNSAKSSTGPPSSVSSVEGSPMLTRKKSSEVDLMKYFGPSTTKSSPSTPSSLVSPSISRKNSVDSPGAVRKSNSAVPAVVPPKPVSPATLAPKPPVVPLPPKKNVLAFQSVKKSKTESVVLPSTPAKNNLAFQPVAKPKLNSPKSERKTKANSPPKKSSPPQRKSPDNDEKLFDDLLAGFDELAKPPTQNSPEIPKIASKTRSLVSEETLFEDLLSDSDKSPKSVRKVPTTASKIQEKPKTPPRRRSPNLDEQLFEDLLEEVDESLVDNFDEILGLPKKQSPKLAKKKTPPKQSPKVSPKVSPQSARKAPPKMTIKRPAFKIVVPVKMQETLEEIYLASLSKLDTRSMSSTSLNRSDSINSKASDSELGKVDEAFEQLLQEPMSNGTKMEPIIIQPFHAPQKKKTNGDKEEEKAVSSVANEQPSERALVSQVSPLEAKPATPKPVKKIVPKKTEGVQKPKTNVTKSEIASSQTKKLIEKTSLISKDTSAVAAPETPKLARKPAIVMKKEQLDIETLTVPPKMIAQMSPLPSIETSVNKTMNPQTTSAIKKVVVQETSIPVSTPVLSRKIVTPTPVTPIMPKKQIVQETGTVISSAATPVLSRKLVAPTPLTAVLPKKQIPQETKPMTPPTSLAPMPIISTKVVAPTPVTPSMPTQQIAQYSNAQNESVPTPVLSRKVVSSTPTMSKKQISQDFKLVTPQTTPLIARKTLTPKVSSESIVQVEPKSEPPLTSLVAQKTVTQDSAQITTKVEKVDTSLIQKSIPNTTPTTDMQPQRERTLSSDDICFQGLRKKHESIFREQQAKSILEAAREVQPVIKVSKRDEFFKDITDNRDQSVAEFVESKPVDVPRTLSEFRSTILTKQGRSEDKIIDGPVFNEQISDLFKEIMPGADLDDMMEEIPIPVERKKSTFQKMFNKLQRANTIAAPEGSALKSLMTPPKFEEYKMEVIRERPAKKEPQVHNLNVIKPIAEPSDRMQINLERTAQIKEKYAKQKASSPPKAVTNLVQESSTQLYLERKTSFKIQTSGQQPKAPSPPKIPAAHKQPAPSPPKQSNSLAAPKPLERKSSVKKQSQPSAAILPPETQLKTKSPPKTIAPQLPLLAVETRRTQQPSKSITEPPNLSDRKLSLKVPKDIDQQRSILSREPAETKKSSDSFEDLFDNVENSELITFEDLLSSDDEAIQHGDVKPKPAFVSTLIQEVKAAPRNKPEIDSNLSSVEPNKKIELISQVSVEMTQKGETVTDVSSNYKNKNDGQTTRNSTAKPLSNDGKSNSSINTLSESEFNKTSKDLTEKFMVSKLQQSQPKQEVGKKSNSFTEAMLTVLTESETISEKDVDILESQVAKVDNSDLINSSSASLTELSALPDVISMTKKQPVEEAAPLKILHYTDKIKQITNHVPQEIQVYTLHTEENKPVEPQPSTSGMTGDYARLLKDITSGLVGADFGSSVVYEPPPVIDKKPKSDFTTYKQILQEKANDPVESYQQHPQRPLRRQKQIDRSVSPPSKVFDNSICIDPRRAKKSSSIENLAIDQVFVKQDDKIIDTFYVVPDQYPQLKRRSKSYDRLDVPGSSRTIGRQQKKSLDELRDYGYDIEPSSASKHLVNPRLRHLNFGESDEDLPNFREPSRRENIRKCKSTIDTSKLDLEATRVDIDRESPIPRATDFSKWEAILDRGVPYYQEPKGHKKEDVRALERKLEDMKVERKPRRKISGKTTIPKDYDPEEYVPRINRRVIDSFDMPNPNLPRSYDPEEYVPKAQRGHMYETDVPISVARSHRTYDVDIPTSTTTRPQRSAAYEIDVPISRVGGKYYPETMHLDDVPMSHTLPRSKTSSHVPYSSVSSMSSRDIAKTQYSRRATVENKSIVNRSQRLHEKANKFIRSQITKNDPNPYIREMADSDDDSYPVTTSSSHRTPITSSYHPVSTYGSSGASAMSRITTKAITQPSRMVHYTRKDVPSPSGTGRSYHRAGESSNRRDNCAIS